MSMTDPIADLLTRIRNGTKAGHVIITVPYSKMKLSIVKLLGEEGFIEGYQEQRDGQKARIRVQLKYDRDRRGMIRGVHRVSRPSRRIYVQRDGVPYVRNGLGVAIMTTSRGVMTDRQARREGVGGEVLCYVW